MSEDQEAKNKGMLDATQAAAYLTEKWGLTVPYNTGTFKKLRQRRGIEPDLLGSNNSYWLKETLDNITPPRNKRPPARTKESPTPLDPPGPGLAAMMYVAS